MKKIFPLIIILNSYLANGQAYSYKPFEIDTSCYWVNNFFYYYGSPFTECRAEKTTVVEKDTLIGPYVFYKLRTYTSEIYSSTPQLACEYFYMQNDIIQYIREDTSARAILDNQNNILLDFNGNIGDTINMGVASINPIIDSITINNFNGTNRKIRWCHWGINNGPFETIEGVGATYNFPPRGYGEWGTPCYNLICYSKQGIKQYPNDSTTLCFKKPPVPVSVENIHIKNLKYKLYNKQLRIESQQFPVMISITDLMGHILLLKTLDNSSNIDLSFLSASIYILRIKSNNGNIIEKVLIE